MITPQNQARTASNPRSIPVAAATDTGPTINERVRRRAYLLFEARQHAGVPGNPVSDWLCAERELNVPSRQPQQARRT